MDEASDAELERLGKLNVLIKEKQIPIANLDLYKPSDVVKELNERLPYEIAMAAHTEAWRYYKVRPKYGVGKPDQTRGEYCVFDKTHGDYVYTRAWVERLARAFSTCERYMRVVGREPKDKDNAA